MISSSAVKGTPTSYVKKTVVSGFTAGATTGQALRADRNGKIYIGGYGGSTSYGIYNARTNVVSAGLTLTSGNFDGMGWDVDSNGVLYYQNTRAVYAIGGSYGNTASNIFTASNSLYSRSLGVTPSGNAIYVQEAGDLKKYSAWSGGTATSNLILTNTYGNGQLYMATDTLANVYFGGPSSSGANGVVKVTPGGSSSAYSSNTYANTGGNAFDWSTLLGIVATSTGVYQTKPLADTLIASGFTNILGVCIDQSSKVIYVFDYVSGGVGNLVSLSPVF